MFDIQTLQSILVLFSVPIILVMIFRKIYLSSVLAYLVSGAIVGENGLNFTSHEQTGFMAEFGVVFLLFSIGLDLSFERLKAMRKYVFGLGSLQIAVTSIMLWSILIMFMDSKAAIIVSGGLALSSTAVVLKILHDKKMQNARLGKLAFAVLLQQDFAVVPLFVILPILASSAEVNLLHSLGTAFGKAILAIGAIFLIGRVFLKPGFKLISSESNQNNNEIFIAATILIALSAAYTTEYMGLSMALGAFMAGILVAETEFRTSAEESIFPFKDLLLGLFFMHVGMTINIFEIAESLQTILVSALFIIVCKTIIVAILCRLFGFGIGLSLNVGLLLSQGSELAFVIFKMCHEYNLLDAKTAKLLLILVTLTMAMTPLMNALGERLVSWLDHKKSEGTANAIEFGAGNLNNHVIICGFGDVGKLIGKILESEEIPYIALDIDRNLVQANYDRYPIYRADATHMEILKAAGIAECAMLILTISNISATRKIIASMHAHYPKINVVAAAHTLDEINHHHVENASMVPSDCETALQISSMILREYSISESKVNRIKDFIRNKNYHISKDILREKANVPLDM